MIVSKEVRILLIEDSEDDAVLLERVLRKDGLNPIIKTISTSDEMKRALDDSSWDAILCDYMMPEFSIPDAMKEVAVRGLDLPFIIVSGTISDETAVEMMKSGVHDYLTKNNLSRLVPAIEREIGEAEQRGKRRAAEEALRESERKHRMLVESLSDTVFVLFPDGEISECYSENGLVPGTGIDSHLGRKISEIFPAAIAGLYSDSSKQVIEKDTSTNFEHPMDIGRERRWFSSSMSLHEDGKRVVVLMRDVTALKKAEEEARTAHNVALLYQDITGHDIRNFLQAILIASDLLHTDEEDLTKLSLIDHISESVTECSDLIRSVQTTATLLSTPLEKTSVDFSLESSIDAFEKNHEDVMIDKKIGVKKAVVYADEFLLHLIANLLDNAEKHNESDDKHVWVELSENGDGYEVTIADNGQGIKDDLKKNLLNPERRAGGVGILQCVQIAKKYGGTLDILDRVEGDPSQGAKFRVWLPRAGQSS
ncbi:MAG: ATP-binding protein [Candidatus Thorarchaeota archaeon]